MHNVVTLETQPDAQTGHPDAARADRIVDPGLVADAAFALDVLQMHPRVDDNIRDAARAIGVLLKSGTGLSANRYTRDDVDDARDLLMGYRLLRSTRDAEQPDPVSASLLWSSEDES